MALAQDPLDVAAEPVECDGEQRPRVVNGPNVMRFVFAVVETVVPVGAPQVIC